MVNYNSWMKGIGDDTYLSKLSIPGTHNSAAYHKLAPPSVQCQGENISEQLRHGVRFLDIRLSTNFLTLDRSKLPMGPRHKLQMGPTPKDEPDSPNLRP